jgi:uncharacterized protein YaaN involved in tellurite resistance
MTKNKTTNTEVIDTEVIEETNNKEVKKNILNPALMPQSVKDINFKNKESLQNLGSEGSTILTNISKTLSENSDIKLKHMGEIGDKITTLFSELKKIDDTTFVSNNNNEKNIIQRIVSLVKDKIVKPIETYAIKEQDSSKIVDKISKELNVDKHLLSEENNRLSDAFTNNLMALEEYEKTINYGYIRLDELKKEFTIHQQSFIENKEEGTTRELLIQEESNYIDLLEQKLASLESVKAIVLRQIPQITIMQNANSQEINNIENVVNTALPLLSQQLALSISSMKTKNALENEKNVRKMINETIIQNSNLMNQNTKQISEGSSGVLIEKNTIEIVNKNIVDSLDILLKSKEVANVKRQESFATIKKLDEDLKKELEKPLTSIQYKIKETQTAIQNKPTR